MRPVFLLTIFLVSLTVGGCDSSGTTGSPKGGEDRPEPLPPEPGVVEVDEPERTPLFEAYDRGLDYLKGAAVDGNFEDPGMTALAAAAFLSRPGGVREEDRAFASGLLEYVVGFQKENGAIYARGLANYTTCAAILALTAAEGGEYREKVDRAVKFVLSLQTEGGGIGYSDKHPGDSDLSNTQFALESLRQAGVPKEHPAFSKALKYLMSVQNRSESNRGGYKYEDGRIVVSLDDGGAFYKPSESKAGIIELSNGRVAFRSYGSMTYALLKCYLLAGLDKDDARVKDAVKWIRKHYTLAENPGFDTEKDPEAGQQGLFYYYFTMARALDLLDVETLADADGLEHEWRKELFEKLASVQGEDGSWVNEADRWMEGMPVLATSYALVTLSYCAR